MQTPFLSSQPLDFNEFAPEEQVDNLPEQKEKTQLARFHAQYRGNMEMNSPIQTVVKYLDAHQGWFCRCAHPMEAEPLGENGYILTIGRFGAFGYEVEPKIAVELLPGENHLYPMKTVPVPEYTPPGYEVDYQAYMSLTEILPKEGSQQAETTTQIEWDLNLDVMVSFPYFIHKLPQGVVQKTGDRLLAKIIQQVSRRLTKKVQEDFHRCYDLPLPPKRKK